MAELVATGHTRLYRRLVSGYRIPSYFMSGVSGRNATVASQIINEISRL
jgi:hypothetical protein